MTDLETENTNDETSSTKRYMLGIFDKIFKAILLNLDNIEYLKYLIHYITKIPLNALKNIKVENALHPVSNKKDKEMESDIVVSIKNKIINIEMDKDYYDGVFQKSDAYLHRIEAKKYDEGENYKNGKQVIQIIFQNFDHFGKGEDIYEFRYYNKKTDIFLENTPVKYFIPLSFIKEKCYNESEFIDGNKFEKYCLMLEEDKEEQLNKIIGDDEVLKKLKENIEKLNEDKDLVVWYDAKKREEMEYKARMEYETRIAKESGYSSGYSSGYDQGKNDGYSSGYSSGQEQGIEEGRSTEKIKLARNFKNQKVDLQIISNATGLSIKEIEKL